MSKTIRCISPIGLIGLGLMGSAMAARLHRAGRQIFGWDISPKARVAFAKLGGTPAQNLTQVFAQCEIILLSLPNSEITAAVLAEAKPFLRANQIIADTSTGDPADAIRFAKQLAARRATYLEATISGNSDQVRRGEVLVMVGGEKSAFAKTKNIFSTFAARTIYTGKTGSAAQMKLVTNLVLGLNRAALAEGLVFARALKLDGDQTLEILRNSMAYSRMMDVKGEKMLRGDFKPQARLSQHLKDVRLMLAAAKSSGTNLPLSKTHKKILSLAESSGLGNLDNSALIRVIGRIRPISRK